MEFFRITEHHTFSLDSQRDTRRPLSPRLANLPPREIRQQLGDAYARVASDLSDGLFMSSRDGLDFNRWDEAFIRQQKRIPTQQKLDVWRQLSKLWLISDHQ